MDNAVEIKSERDLFESVLCGIFRCSIEDDPKILEFNSASAKIYGYETKEAFREAGFTRLFSLVYEYDLEIVRGFIRRCRKNGQTVNFGHRILKKDKTIAYIMGSLRVVEMEDGRKVLEGIFMDSGHGVVQADIRKSIFYKPSETKKNARRVLIVEEEEKIRTQLRDILQTDYAWIEAKTGQEALSILQKEKDEIAVILASLSIVSQNNFGFIASVKGSMQYTSIPIVVLGEPDSGSEEEVLSAGVNEYFEQPFHPNIMRLRLANLMELRDTAIQRNAVETIVDNIPGGILLARVAKKAELIFASGGVAKIGGRTEEEFENFCRKDLVGTLVSEKDRARINARIASSLSTGKPAEFTMRAIHKEGTEVWVHVHAVRVRMENGCPVYQVIVSPTTVAEKMYQNMLDEAPSAISVFSVDTNELLYINNAAGKLMETFPNLNDSLEQLNFDEYKVKQIIPENSKRHLTLNGKLINWNGIKSKIIYITDDTERYYAQLERHELYETEMMKLSAKDENIVGTAIFNLSKNVLVELNTKKELNKSVFAGQSLEETMYALRENITKAEEQREFSRQFSLKALRRAYNDNNRRIHLRCRCKDVSGRFYWMEFRCNIIEKPRDGDILAFGYAYDIDEEMIRQNTFSRTLGMEAEMVSYVNTIDDTIHPLLLKEENPFVFPFSVMPYGDYIYQYLPRIIHEEDLQKGYQEFSVKDMKKRLEREKVISIFYRTRPGEGRCYRKKVQVFYIDEDRQLICLVQTDITDVYEEQVENNHRLQIALQEAKQASEAKSMFLSRMSHEIRTPMNAILGLSGLAFDEADDPEAIRDYLDKINSSGQYLLGLISDILDMSKIESEKIKLKKEPYSIKECIDFVMISMSAQFEAKNLHFTYQEKGLTHRRFQLDKMRFQQIFFNLLSNAVKFTKNGGDIGIDVKQMGKEGDKVRVCMSVRDNGKGIDADSLQQIFEPFEQAKRQDSIKYGGTGLGLAIVKNLVKLMDGTISVKSTRGKGTAFFIELLLLPVYEEEASLKKRMVRTKPEYDFTGKHILVVEDHKINMEILKKLLEKNHCTVTAVEDGKEAVALFSKAKEGVFQAILMDVRMPVMDGIEATKRIRNFECKNPERKPIPIIAMTANAFEEDARKTKSVGMNAHLTKPIDQERLYQTLYDFLK